MPENLSLHFGFSFEDLHCRDGLVRLDRCFVDFLAVRDVELHNRLMAARAAPDAVADKAESELLIALAPQLEDFVGRAVRHRRRDGGAAGAPAARWRRSTR